MWHVTYFGGWTFSQNFSSLALMVCELWYLEDWEEKADGLTEWINNEGVCRTAPATPDLLNTSCNLSFMCISVEFRSSYITLGGMWNHFFFFIELILKVTQQATDFGYSRLFFCQVQLFARGVVSPRARDSQGSTFFMGNGNTAFRSSERHSLDKLALVVDPFLFIQYRLNR